MIAISRTRIQIHALMILSLALITAALPGQESTTGTPVGKPIPKLETVVCVGENEGQKQELTAKRLGKPTIYVFIQAEHWDRPLARLLRELDQKTKEHLTDGTVVAVWLSNQEVDRFREHLPRVQQSLKLAMTTYTVRPGDPFGPPAWSINRDDHVTVITVKDAKTLGRHSFKSTNEGDAARILTDLGIKD
ncbi:MAG: hypothetical protein WCJ40_08905 [Planctomycetota bacterium]